jgi:hypothetical protein
VFGRYIDKIFHKNICYTFITLLPEFVQTFRDNFGIAKKFDSCV